MNNLTGYLISGAPADRTGLAYNYIFAGNGVWITARNEHLLAQIPVAAADVRGLPPIKAWFELTHGRVPQRLFDLALSVFLASPEEERYIGVRWDGHGYRLYVPSQAGSGAKVEYTAGEDIVVEMHSHPNFGPGFTP